MKKTILRSATAVLCAASVLFCGSCAKDKDDLKSTKVEQTVLMTIDGYEVPLELYRYVALNYKADYESGKSSDIWLGETGSALLAELNESVNETLVSLYSVLCVCDDYGIDPASQYITDTVEYEMDAVYTSYDRDYDAYLEDLRTANMNDAVYRFILRNDILSEELLEKMKEQGDIPDDQATIRAALSGDDFIRVKQILISTEETLTDDEALAKAEDLWKQVEAGANFDKLIQEHGRDLFMFSNDDGYYICRGTYQKSFEEAAFALAIGEHSGVIRTDAGYSILKRYEKEEDYLTTHYEELAELYQVSALNLFLEQRMEGIAPVATEKLAEYTIFNLESTK